MTVKKAGLDYEQYRNFTVTVNSTDSGFPPYTVTGSFEIRVNNINEKPQSVSLDNSKVCIVSVSCYRLFTQESSIYLNLEIGREVKDNTQEPKRMY